MKTIILCGFMCAGKSTIGELCASQLTCDFYDIDRMIESVYGGGTSVRMIWKEIGSLAFRNLESKMICSLNITQGVIALGGGSLLWATNRTYLKKIGISIYLNASIETLFHRISQRGLPDYIDNQNPFEHVKQIFLERASLYQEYCHYILNTDHTTPQEIATNICKLVI